MKAPPPPPAAARGARRRAGPAAGKAITNENSLGQTPATSTPVRGSRCTRIFGPNLGTWNPAVVSEIRATGSLSPGVLEREHRHAEDPGRLRSSRSRGVYHHPGRPAVLRRSGATRNRRRPVTGQRQGRELQGEGLRLLWRHHRRRPDPGRRAPRVDAPHFAKHASLIRIRTNFIPEIIKSGPRTCSSCVRIGCACARDHRPAVATPALLTWRNSLWPAPRFLSRFASSRVTSCSARSAVAERHQGRQGSPRRTSSSTIEAVSRDARDHRQVNGPR